MNSNYVLYTDEERKEIDEMQREENKKLFFEEGFKQGFKQWFEQGFEQEFKQGELNKQNEIITNMLKEKTSINFISRVTNKPVQEIKKIATSLNLI